MEADKKTEILNAAAKCFARYGYEKTTLDDIGKLVGLNKASLYYYYKNKESIYTEVIFTEAKAFLTGIMEHVGKAESCQDKVYTYFRERLVFIRDSLNLSQLSEDSAQKIAPMFGDMYTGIMDMEIANLSGILDGCIAAGELKACESHKVASSMLMYAEAVRSKIDCHLSTPEAFAAVLSEIEFTLALILNGLAV